MDKERASLFSKIAAEMGSCANTTFDKQIIKYNELRELAKGDPEALEMLDKWGAQAQAKASKTMEDTDNTWLQGQIGQFNAKANEISGRTDLGMIELQSMIEKRSRVIAFASKVVASINDSVKEVVNNIR